MQNNALHRTPASGAIEFCGSATTSTKDDDKYGRAEENHYETDGYCNSRRLL